MAKFEWVPSWQGRRWELLKSSRRATVMVGRVVRFSNGQIEAHVQLPLYKAIVGPFASLSEAGGQVLAAVRAVKQGKRCSRR